MRLMKCGSYRDWQWMGALCLAFVAIATTSLRADDWPQWLGPQRDSVWREDRILDKFPDGGPKVRWRSPVGGGYAGPAVSGGHVYVMDRVLGAGSRNPDDQFQRGNVEGAERVLCLSEADGKMLWKHEYPCRYTVSYPAGPRTTPVVAGGKVYTLGSEGDLRCLETESGKLLWSHDLKQDYGIKTAVWGFASNPLLDGPRLICMAGGEGTGVLAFDKDSGKEIWRALNCSGPHGPGYGSPMIVEAGGRRQLIVWHTEALSSLDPETGRILWEQPFRIKNGQTVPTPRQYGDLLFVTGFYDGCMLLRLHRDQPGASVVWQRKGVNERDTDGLHSVICTPFLENGHIYGVCSFGQFRCLTADTGDRLWETFQVTGAAGNGTDRWATAFIVKNGGRFFIFSEQGDLIIARLSPRGYEEVSRAHILEPTNTAQRRNVVWSHPAFANRSIYARNDKEIVCVSLAAKEIK